MSTSGNISQPHKVHSYPFLNLGVSNLNSNFSDHVDEIPIPIFRDYDWNGSRKGYRSPGSISSPCRPKVTTPIRPMSAASPENRDMDYSSFFELTQSPVWPRNKPILTHIKSGMDSPCRPPPPVHTASHHKNPIGNFIIKQDQQISAPPNLSNNTTSPASMGDNTINLLSNDKSETILNEINQRVPTSRVKLDNNISMTDTGMLNKSSILRNELTPPPNNYPTQQSVSHKASLASQSSQKKIKNPSNSSNFKQPPFKVRTYVPKTVLSEKPISRLLSYPISPFENSSQDALQHALHRQFVSRQNHHQRNFLTEPSTLPLSPSHRPSPAHHQKLDSSGEMQHRKGVELHDKMPIESNLMFQPSRKPTSPKPLCTPHEIPLLINPVSANTSDNPLSGGDFSASYLSSPPRTTPDSVNSLLGHFTRIDNYLPSRIHPDVYKLQSSSRNFPTWPSLIVVDPGLDFTLQPQRNSPPTNDLPSESNTAVRDYPARSITPPANLVPSPPPSPLPITHAPILAPSKSQELPQTPNQQQLRVRPQTSLSQPSLQFSRSSASVFPPSNPPACVNPPPVTPPPQYQTIHRTPRQLQEVLPAPSYSTAPGGKHRTPTPRGVPSANSPLSPPPNAKAMSLLSPGTVISSMSPPAHAFPGGSPIVRKVLRSPPRPVSRLLSVSVRRLLPVSATGSTSPPLQAPRPSTAPITPQPLFIPPPSVMLSLAKETASPARARNRSPPQLLGFERSLNFASPRPYTSGGFAGRRLDIAHHNASLAPPLHKPIQLPQKSTCQVMPSPVAPPAENCSSTNSVLQRLQEAKMALDVLVGSPSLTCMSKAEADSIFIRAVANDFNRSRLLQQNVRPLYQNSINFEYKSQNENRFVNSPSLSNLNSGNDVKESHFNLMSTGTTNDTSSIPHQSTNQNFRTSPIRKSIHSYTPDSNDSLNQLKNATLTLKSAVLSVKDATGGGPASPMPFLGSDRYYYQR